MVGRKFADFVPENRAAIRRDKICKKLSSFPIKNELYVKSQSNSCSIDKKELKAIVLVQASDVQSCLNVLRIIAPKWIWLIIKNVKKIFS